MSTNVAPPRTLSEAFAIWRRKTSVRIMAAVLAAAVAVRIALGDLGRWDLAIVALFAAYQPLQEWLIHVFVLHFKPVRLLGRTIDPFIARKHRYHHENPGDLDAIFIPLSAIPASLALNVLIWWALLPTPGLAVTAVATLTGLGIVYEWTHFLIHTAYVPRTRFYRELWRLHRLHHFKNENYWFGVTSHLGDRVLGTNPDPKAVPLSPTARTLGVEA